MNYNQTVNFLYDLLPAYQKQGRSAFKKDLTNIKKLCEALKNPQDTYPTIHVGGTNGKGTVSHMLASVLQEGGMTVGLYTSPHYVDFRERIKINGHYISEEKVIDFVKQNRNLIKEIEPSFFEMTVAMAFDHFSIENVDVAVIEVGLGGRLDSTNIITPNLSVITNIGLDHQDMLGDTISEIAGEKAGIIKSGIPVVIGEWDEISSSVFIEKASKLKSSIHFASENWDVRSTSESLHFINRNTAVKYDLSITDINPFTLLNMTTVLEACSKMQYIDFKEKVNYEAIQNGLERYKVNTGYKGRWQLLSQAPDVIADSGHNTHALEKSINYLSALSYRKIHFVLGFVKGKDVREIMKFLPNDGQYYWCRPSIFRGLETENISLVADEFSLSYNTYISVDSAYGAACRCAAKDDLVFVGGSSFVVGELLENLSL